VTLYLDVPLHRLWRLTVTKPNVQHEYLVPQSHLADLIDSVASEPLIQDLRCAPYHGANYPLVADTDDLQKRDGAESAGLTAR